MCHGRFHSLHLAASGRLGVVIAIAIPLGTPMVWALGAFGAAPDEALRHAVIFAFSGMWLGLGLGYGVSWALHGFVLRSREPEDEDDAPPARPAGRPPPPPAPPRPGPRRQGG